MTARILVVDDAEANVRLLEAKLSAEYYDVLTAPDGPSALVMAAEQAPDIILLDVMMPGMDGLEVCRRLKADAATRHIPVVLVTALDGRRDRLSGLEAGADDFLTKPIDDLALFARVRSLVRLKLVIDELRHREASGRRMGVIEGAAARMSGGGGLILIADDNDEQIRVIEQELSQDHRIVVERNVDQALPAARGRADLLVINVASRSHDALRLAAQIRSDEATRHLPIIAIVEGSDRARMVKALELGVNDVLTRPVDPEELAARVRTLIRQKRYYDFLRNNLDQSLELAVTDPLTGLHNRRYMSGQLTALVRRATHGGEPVSALLVDIDHFKRINDSFGHAVGDEVLREFAIRLATNVRAIDLACRYGGEEFVVIMPDTALGEARAIAERLRRHVAGSPFHVSGVDDPLSVTISVGVATTLDAPDTAQDLLKRADDAVYDAKAQGRNLVIASAA
jgi:two-component system cell cycle response regulator